MIDYHELRRHPQNLKFHLFKGLRLHVRKKLFLVFISKYSFKTWIVKKNLFEKQAQFEILRRINSRKKFEVRS